MKEPSARTYCFLLRLTGAEAYALRDVVRTGRLAAKVADWGAKHNAERKVEIVMESEQALRNLVDTLGVRLGKKISYSEYA